MTDVGAEVQGWGWRTCLKQATRCVVITDAGEKYEGTNLCAVGDADVCPRIEAECPTGEGYDLCGPPIHAEAAAAELVPRENVGGTAYLYGHTWLCGPCQWALIAKGVRTFVVTGEPA